MNEQIFIDQVSLLMQKNRRSAGVYTYTVPSPEHYPFQWLWDSCFHAIILSHFDTAQAQDEIRSVLAKPLANGLIPHMIYWDTAYQTIKWGRELQGDVLSAAWGTNGVSSITQPPLLATAVWRLHERTQEIGFLKEIYPVMRTYYLHLLTDRSFGAHGLLGIINPDESGEDNSPRFDALQGLPDRHTPLENFNRRIARVHEHVACNFDVQGCMRKHFWIEDVSFNAITLRSLEAMAQIAREIGELSESITFTLCAHQLRASMQLHMSSGYRYFSLQGERQEKILVETWGLFMPLYAGLLHKDQAKLLIEKHLLNTDKFFTHFPIPSVSYHEPSYTDNDLWRGPTWIAINWFIYKGLIDYGYIDLARTLKKKTTELITQSGFREFYNAQTGEGYGAHDFTWGGLVLDMN
jgi:glycogen debranching enzyme